MDNYKEKLRIDNLIIVTVICILLIACILALLAEAGVIPILNPIAADDHWQSKWRGFITGAAAGIIGLMAYRLLRNCQALKDEKKLKKLYVQDHDERLIQVWTYARATGMQTCLLLGLAAVIVSGYFSITVSITILACVLCASLICLWFKVYYSKKF